MAVTRVDGRLDVSVVQDVTSDAMEDVGIGLTGVSESEIDEVVAVSVPLLVEALAVSEVEEVEAGTDSVCDVVEVTDVVLRVVAV